VALRRLLDHADAAKATDQSAGDYLRTTATDVLRPLVADLLDLGDGSATELDFWDIGASQQFLGEAASEGECAV
jgi:hypothetical protein